MTEDEAKTKWCPYSRVLIDAEVGNRYESDAKKGLSAPHGSSCVASECMSWRFIEERRMGYDLSVHTRRHGEELGKSKHAEWMQENPPLGYCGLAGKP